jgi:hypothetical protein
MEELWGDREHEQERMGGWERVGGRLKEGGARLLQYGARTRGCKVAIMRTCRGPRGAWCLRSVGNNEHCSIQTLKELLILPRKFDWKHHFRPPLSPNPVVHWFWRKRKSCRALRGEQH